MTMTQTKSDLSVDTRQGRCYTYICIRLVRMMSLGHVIAYLNRDDVFLLTRLHVF